MPKHIVPYDLPVLFDAGGDLSVPWYVYYKYRRPDGKGKERFRIKGLDGVGDINRQKEKKGRYYIAGLIISALTELLESGYNPFVLSEKQQYTKELTLQEGIKAFLTFKQASTRLKTYKGYKSTCDTFSDWASKNKLLQTPVTAIKSTTIQHYFDYRKSTVKITNTTYNSDHNKLSMLFYFFVNRVEGYINPFKVKRIPNEEVRQHKVYTAKEKDKLLMYIKKRDTVLLCYVLFVYYVCLRPNEGKQLRVGDIDLENRKLWLKSDQTKNKASDSLPITAGLMSVIQKMGLEKCKPDWYVFGEMGKPGPKPCGYNFFTRRFRELADELKLSKDYTLYGLKHTRNVELYLQYKDPYRNMRLNRHRDLKTTMKYLREIGFFVEDSIENETIYF